MRSWNGSSYRKSENRSPPDNSGHNATQSEKLIDFYDSSPKSKRDEQSVTTTQASGDSMPHGDNCVLPDEEARRMLTIQELLFQDRLLMKDREWSEKTKQLETANTQLNEQLEKLQTTNQQLVEIIGEYEKTLVKVIADKDREKLEATESVTKITKERDQALEDLQNVETAFADLHRRYEKLKEALISYRKNEETLKDHASECREAIKKANLRYDTLKTVAEEKIEGANMEIESVRKAGESELASLRAQLKKSEMRIDSLETSVEQKAKENVELTKFCDELIARVGRTS